MPKKFPHFKKPHQPSHPPSTETSSSQTEPSVTEEAEEEFTMHKDNGNSSIAKLSDGEHGNKTTATLNLFDDKGEAITVKDPATIKWATTPSDALKLTPQPDGTVQVEAVAGSIGNFPLTGTDPASGKEATGMVTVASSKPQSNVSFG